MCVRRTWFLDLPEHAVNESVISPVVCAKERRRAVGQSLTSRSCVGPPRRGARKNAAVAQCRYQSGLCEQMFAALEHRCEALAHPFKRNAMRVQLPVLLQPAAKVLDAANEGSQTPARACQPGVAPPRPATSSDRV